MGTFRPNAEPIIDLCQRIRNEFYKSEYMFKNAILITSKNEYTNIKRLENISSDNYDEIRNVLQNMYNRIIAFNILLSNHIQHFKMFDDKNSKQITESSAYKHINLVRYRENYKSNCVIVNIEDDANKIYIYDLKNTTEYDNFYNSLYTYNKYKYNWFKNSKSLPTPNEVFGIVINNSFYRVVRQDNIVLNNIFFGLLIDHGKIVELSTENVFYLLPSCIQEQSPLAICCKVDNIINESKEEFLQEGLLNKYSFAVNKNCGNHLQITLIAFTNPFIRELSINECKWFAYNLENVTTNEATKYNSCVANQENKDCKLVPDVISDSLSISTNLKQFLESSLAISHLKNGDDHNNEEIMKEVKYDEISEQQLKILNEEPTMYTSNALKAVMGYVPKDELRICQFTNDEGRCFKGIHCNKEHNLKIPGGWTRDQEQVQVDLPITIEILEVGSYIFIIPTYLINITTFYGHVIDKENVYQKTLEQLTFAMNDTIQINKYRDFSPHNLPQERELVIAKDDDGWYCRARVVFEIDNGCRVFYVDYGNEADVIYTDLRKWEKQFEVLPFQAIRFQLVNVKTKTGITCDDQLLSKAQKFLINNFLDFKFLAKVINNINEVIVKINFTLDNKNFDLSELLVTKGFAEYKGNEFINSISSNIARIPG